MAVIFNDTFTGSNGTQLQSHAPDTGTSWTRLWGSDANIDWVITSNMANPEGVADGGSLYTADATYPSANYELQYTFVGAPAAGGGVRCTYYLLRVQDVDNMYALRIGLANSASQAQIYKKVSGSWSTIGSAFTSPALGSVVKFQINGSTLKVFDDAAEIASETDTAISAAGKAGIGAGGGAELVTSTDDSYATNVIDAFSVNDLGAGASTAVPVFMHHYQFNLGR